MEIVHLLPTSEGAGLTPSEIVARLDEYIVGQNSAKRAVAVAIRNRWRRKQVVESMRKEIMPRNILMVGPTGVGKTEIARRLAALVDAPFIKVEASKYTEVGYHGRDVESMVRDLVKVAVAQYHAREIERVSADAQVHAADRVLDLLLPAPIFSSDEEERRQAQERHERTREKLRGQLMRGDLDDRQIEISAEGAPPVAGVFGAIGGDDMMGLEMQDMLSRMIPGRSKARRVTVREGLRLYTQEEAEKLIDEEAINRLSIERAEQDGIIFIDEIDKVVGSDKESGPDVSREGVQRDLLPIVEGSTVATKFGPVNTDHILFIAAGAFHGKKPSDLIPELQGRFPIRVELTSLTREDFVQILTHPKNALTIQYELLMNAEGIKLNFEKAALSMIAEIAARVNSTTEDIGARRLYTVMERIFDEISFDAPQMRGTSVTVTPALVRDKLSAVSEDEDLSRFVL